MIAARDLGTTRTLDGPYRANLTLIITPLYSRACELAGARTPGEWPDDWFWFADFGIAKDWFRRCEARGVAINCRWLIG